MKRQGLYDVVADTMERASNPKQIFTAAQIPEIIELFKQADLDGGGGLDIEEFCKGLNDVFGTDNTEELTALFHKIDTNCDGTVDLGELLEFLVCKNEVSKGFDHKYIFPKDIKVTPLDQGRGIVQMLFRPDEEEEEEPGCESAVQTRSIRTYQRGQYMSISSDAIFTYMSDRFDTPCQIEVKRKEKGLPYSNDNKTHVTGMAYIKELRQVAISTSQKEIVFYSCKDTSFAASHSLFVEDDPVSAINYRSKDNKGVLSFGDVKGYLYVLISYNVQKNGLFGENTLDDGIFVRPSQNFCVSTLLKERSKDFRYVKIHIFEDICNQIQYFPTIESLAICGRSSKTMVVVSLPQIDKANFPKTVFTSPSDKAFFTCVEYFPSTGNLVTGGTDGLLREWYLHKTMSCKQSIAGHVKPITHITLNRKDNVFVTLSKDKNVRVWSEDLLPLQSFQVQGMENGSIASMCYNTYNNELVLANTKIGSYLGRGTDVFQNALTSHDKPLCCALYHSPYKQVVSVCQDGVVTVWDVSTGQVASQFKVTPDKHVGHTAIAFDEPQRKLITVSQDRKLKFWNFNNGALLSIIPVALPKEVTGIVCLNNRVFVSEGNSNIIHDLDMEGFNNRSFSHHYLKDISSMDVHEETLITASSNGNIVIWDADHGKALHWMNDSKSPRIFRVDRRLTGSRPDEKYPQKSQTGNKKANLVVCLKKRKVKDDTATLLTSADGYICAWSVSVNGGLTGKFRAVDKEGAVITTMSTDLKEQILMTGDSTGKFCQWDIASFGFRKQAKEEPFEDRNGWHVSLAQPPLLGSWQCHLTEVVSVQCDHSCKTVVTAGLDRYLHLWHNTGSHIGVFGKDKWIDSDLSFEKNADQEEAAGSATTLTTNDEKPIIQKSPSPIPNLENLYDKINKVCNQFKELKDTPCPPNILPGKQEKKQTSEHVRFPPTRDRVQVKHHQTQLKPQPPQTPLMRGGADLKQSSPQTLNQTRSKYTCVLKIRQGDTFKDNVLTPCPPNTLPGKQETKQTSEHIRFQPTRGRVQGTHHQTQLKPQLPQTPLIRGGADLKQSTPQTIDRTTSKYDSVLKIRQGDTFKDSDLTPCPPSSGRHHKTRPPHHLQQGKPF